MNDRLVALVDMDCFYCQVETRLNPSLKGKPMAVVQYNQWKGGGIIAVNYEARDRGVTRHMRGDEAKKHCPEIQLVSVPAVRGKADLTKYRDAGREVINVICEFSECVQRASVDEAYIDLTEAVEKRLNNQGKVTPASLENSFIVGYSPAENNDEEDRVRGVSAWLEEVYGGELHDQSLHRLASAAALVEEMRSAVFEKTGFRCSAGISHNKILAKLVCGMHKPNRQTVLPFSSVAELYRTLPVKKVRNLGGKLGDDVVETLGITHMAELTNFTEKQLQAKYDDKTGTWLYNIARGVDLDPVTPRLVSKSIGCCKRFPGKTALTTKSNVTHWLSELASEVAERLEEDIHMNKRKAQLLTIHFSQEISGKDVSMSRSVALPGYEAEKIAACAFSVLGKNSSQTDDAWYPHLKFLGLSAGKFMEYSVNSKNSINNFFKAIAPAESKPSTSNLPDEEVPIHAEICLKESVDSPSCKIIEINENQLEDKVTETKEPTQPKEKGSFFVRYFKNQPNKIINNGLVKKKETSDVTNKVPDHKELRLKNENSLDKKVDNQNQTNEINERRNIEANEENLNGAFDSWISPSELFPDMENADDSLINMLPSPMQQKISELKKSKSFSAQRTKSEINRVYPNSSRVSTDSDCAPTRVETVADIHSSLRRKDQQNQVLERIAQKHPRKEEVEEEDIIEQEDLMDTTSPDIFEAEVKESIATNLCSYCSKSIPLYELQEHLDHHVAMELQEQWNKEPQVNRTATVTDTKSIKPAICVSEKKKRGRPSKKDVVPPKKAKTIMSFFTKS